MNAEDLKQASSSRRGAKGWMWLLLGLFAAGVVASFWYTPAEAEKAKRSNGPQAIAVAAEPIARGQLTERARYPGELRADTAEVGTLQGGRLAEVMVRVGDEVKTGQVLARLDPADLHAQIAEAKASKTAAEANRKRLQAELAMARRDAERLKNLNGQNLVSQSELELAQSKSTALSASVSEASAGIQQAKARESTLEVKLSELEVKAPFDGRIAHRYVDAGTIINAGTPLLRVVAEAPLRVSFEVPERDLALIQPDLEVELLALNVERSYRAKVLGVAAQVQGASRKAQAEGELLEAPSHWRAGMYVDVLAPVRTSDTSAWTIPSEALLTRLLPSGEVKSGVFLADGDKARWVEVMVLAREATRLAVSAIPPEALGEGAQVLTQGHSDLVDGAAIRVGGHDAEKQP